MWFDSDKPYEQESHDGFPDLITHVYLMAWICLAGYVGFVAAVLL